MHAPASSHARWIDLAAARFQSAMWILVSAIPIIFLARLFVLTIYSVPESDDFCLSYMNLREGFIETASVFYHT
jgi:hypothetical protein